MPLRLTYGLATRHADAICWVWGLIQPVYTVVGIDLLLIDAHTTSGHSRRLAAVRQHRGSRRGCARWCGDGAVRSAATASISGLRHARRPAVGLVWRAAFVVVWVCWVRVERDRVESQVGLVEVGLDGADIRGLAGLGVRVDRSGELVGGRGGEGDAGGDPEVVRSDGLSDPPGGEGGL